MKEAKDAPKANKIISYFEACLSLLAFWCKLEDVNVVDLMLAFHNTIRGRLVRCIRITLNKVYY